MRTLEKGFGNCSLRTSTFICLIVILVLNVFMFLGAIGGYGDPSFIARIGTIILTLIWVAVFGYTIYTLHRNDPSLLNVALVALIINIILIILGILFSLFSALLSPSTYLVVLPVLAFEMYSVWVIYSYSIEFNQPVSVHA